MSHVDKIRNLGAAPYGYYERDGCTYAYTFDERLQQERARGRDDGWESAWEIVTGGTAVELPWPERLRLVKRILEASEVYFGDAGGTVLAHLPERVPDAEQRATLLPVPEYEGLR